MEYFLKYIYQEAGQRKEKIFPLIADGEQEFVGLSKDGKNHHALEACIQGEYEVELLGDGASIDSWKVLPCGCIDYGSGLLERCVSCAQGAVEKEYSASGQTNFFVEPMRRGRLSSPRII
jgi:hypothetical protein